jgi:hypothetical protein
MKVNFFLGGDDTGIDREGVQSKIGLRSHLLGTMVHIFLLSLEKND